MKKFKIGQQATLVMLTIAFLLCCKVANAQGNVKVPKFHSYVTFLSEDVNVRKAPSATSAKLVVVGVEEEIGYTGFSWSSGKLKKNERVYHPEKYLSYAVAKEQGEWFQIIIPSYGFDSYHEVGYVMKKFTKQVDNPFPTITAEMIQKLSRESHLRKSGLYKDCFFLPTEGMDFSYTYLGKVYNNMIVCSHNMNCYPAFWPDQSQALNVEKAEDGDYVSFISYNKSLVKHVESNEFSGDVLDYKKLSDGQISQIFRYAFKKPVKEVVIYRWNSGTNCFIGEAYDLEKISKYVPLVELGPVTTVKSDNNDNTVYQVVDEMPQFPGGAGALTKYLADNVRYPEKSFIENQHGRVVVKFIVEKDGSISNIQVVRSVSSELDKESIRVISCMPLWTPGSLKGNIVRVSYCVPITYKKL